MDELINTDGTRLSALASADYTIATTALTVANTSHCTSTLHTVHPPINHADRFCLQALPVIKRRDRLFAGRIYESAIFHLASRQNLRTTSAAQLSEFNDNIYNIDN